MTPPLIYHYTDAKGLQGIVSDRELWATNIQFLNDAQEGYYGQRLLHASLIKAANGISTDPNETSPEATHAYWVRLIAEAILNDPALSMDIIRQFVVCFCEDGDLLSQWRGYAGAGGYSLGFATDKLPEKLLQMDYDFSGLEGLVQYIVEERARFAGFPGASSWIAAQEIIAKWDFPSKKHDTFKEESEWRMVRQEADAGRCRFRISSTMGLVPYLPVPFPADALVTVNIGPGGDTDLRGTGTRKFLDANGYGNVELLRSRAPFRP